MKSRERNGGKKKDQSIMKMPGWIGLIVIGVSEISLSRGVPFVGNYFTPLVWSGYILFTAGLMRHWEGSSFIPSRARDFMLLFPLSIGLWLIFEFYNFYMQNWHYIGLPQDRLLRWLGYAWAFATIWPAILLTAGVLERWKWLSPPNTRHFRITRKHLVFSLAGGIFCLTLPLIAPQSIAKYLAAPVWLGFIFLLDPLNYWMGSRSLFKDLEEGNPGILYRLLFSGIICGVLWEFWNFWASAKWKYDVPILGNVKIFEMPILGYLGFPAFALEVYVMYAFILNIFSARSNS